MQHDEMWGALGMILLLLTWGALSVALGLAALLVLAWLR